MQLTVVESSPLLIGSTLEINGASIFEYTAELGEVISKLRSHLLQSPECARGMSSREPYNILAWANFYSRTATTISYIIIRYCLGGFYGI